MFTAQWHNGQSKPGQTSRRKTNKVVTGEMVTIMISILFIYDEVVHGVQKIHGVYTKEEGK